MKKKKKSQGREIVWNIVNSLLAGGLVFLGSLLNGQITEKGLIVAGITAGVLMLTKFYDYWKKEESEYCASLGNFI